MQINHRVITYQLVCIWAIYELTRSNESQSRSYRFIPERIGSVHQHCTLHLFNTNAIFLVDLMNLKFSFQEINTFSRTNIVFSIIFRIPLCFRSCSTQIRFIFLETIMKLIRLNHGVNLTDVLFSIQYISLAGNKM